VWINTSFEKLINFVVTHFLDLHTKERGKEKIQKKKKKKIVRIKQKKNQWEKDTKVPKNGLRLVEEDKNYKD
jgi:hypothetical protein